jgi:heme/copper-type cytochrome/quinol oxidase subunit 2
MTITPGMIYLISLADSMIALFVIFIIISFISMFLIRDHSEATGRDGTNKLCVCLLVLLFSIVSLVFIPSSKTLTAMYVIPTVVNNKEVQKLPENIIKFVNSYLENNKEEK